MTKGQGNRRPTDAKFGREYIPIDQRTSHFSKTLYGAGTQAPVPGSSGMAVRESKSPVKKHTRKFDSKFGVSQGVLTNQKNSGEKYGKLTKSKTKEEPSPKKST